MAKLNDATALAASDPKIIKSVIGPDEIHLYESKEQHGNWLDCIISRREPISPVEMGHRACSTCLHARHGDGAEAQALLGPGEGALQERRRSEQHACRVRSARPIGWPDYAVAGAKNKRVPWGSSTPRCLCAGFSSVAACISGRSRCCGSEFTPARQTHSRAWQ